MSASMPASEPASAEEPAAEAAASRLTAAYVEASSLARRHDPDRWLASLWASDDRRPHLHALYAFSAEIARIRDLVSDPLPGEIRVRWWADMLAGRRGGEGDAHPIAACLVDTVRRFDLPLEPLDRLIEARIFDLYDDPMPNLAEFDAYCDDTVGTVVGLGCRLLGGDCADPGVAAAIRAAGRAWGATGLMRALPFHAARGQIFLPVDLLRAHGGDPADLLAGRPNPALTATLSALRGRTREALAETRRLIGHIPISAAPAFLAVTLVEPMLDVMDRPDWNPFRDPVALPPWRRHWRLWRSARRAHRAAKRRGEIM
ncbi:MAG: squalene/phytoene synthase family protein [Hyphomicrobiales bacterium]|nr:squalene/phytoene synthase family protein [Hyphomicrobiales bacterium]